MTHWRSIHIYHYAPNVDDLLCDAVRPVFEQVAQQVDGAFFARHWRRGPHVRLNFKTSDQAFDQYVNGTVRDRVGSFLKHHPSRLVCDPVAMVAQHQRLAELENKPAPVDDPLIADNTICEASFDSRERILGSQKAAELLLEFHCESTPLAFDLLESVRGGTPRNLIAFDIMVTTAHALSGIGIDRGFVSFRSHADAFLSWWPEAEGLRDRWDDYLDRHERVLVDHVQRVVTAAETSPTASAVAQRWVATLGPYWPIGGALLDSGAIAMDPPWADLDLRDPANAHIVAMLRQSPFHGSRLDRQRRVHQAWFDRYRLMLNYAYLFLTRLGITPVERFLLCHLVAGTVERLYGVTAADVPFPDPDESMPNPNLRLVSS